MSRTQMSIERRVAPRRTPTNTWHTKACRCLIAHCTECTLALTQPAFDQCFSQCLTARCTECTLAFGSQQQRMKEEKHEKGKRHYSSKKDGWATSRTHPVHALSVWRQCQCATKSCTQEVVVCACFPGARCPLPPQLTCPTHLLQHPKHPKHPKHARSSILLSTTRCH